MRSLPIYEIENSIIESFRESNQLIFSAPTGSGKSTQVPQILHDKLVAERILVLQPRRLAAMMLANRVSEERGEKIGEEVGFITRFEKAVSAKTKICFVTTGILPRMLASDPNLVKWDAVIFDEFHERSALQDISIGLIRDLQKKRKSLKLLVMSATLESKLLQEYLPKAKVLESAGKIHPIEQFYEPPRAQQPIWEAAKKSLVNILNRGEGDVLIFMPGAFEIHKTITECKTISSSQKLEFLPLYGAMNQKDQNLIMHKNDKIRRIIVATNIAETSLTIPGVRHVIDSGLAKVNRFHPGRGINILDTEPISQFSADQRKGRAGREAAGTCTRLWREKASGNAKLEPEVNRIDLAETVLQTMQFGYNDIEHFPWLTIPRNSAVTIAVKLLKKLNFVTETDELTEAGKIAAQLPIHPRMAKMLISANSQNCVVEAALTAALLNERPILLNGKNRLKKLSAFFDTSGETVASKKRRPRLVENRDENPISDIEILIRAMKALYQSKFDLNLCQQMGINRNAAIAVWRNFEQIVNSSKRHGIDIKNSGDFIGLAKSLLSAYFDHIACRRDTSSHICFTSNGRADLSSESIVTKSKIFISTNIRKSGNNSTQLCNNCELREEWIEEVFPDAFQIVEHTSWNDVNQRVEKHHQIKCLDVVIEDKLVKDDTFYKECGVLLAEGIIKKKLVLPTWDKDVKNWVSRVRWLAQAFPEKNLITYDFDDYQCIIEEFCDGESSYQKVRNKPVMPYVKNALSWEDQQFVEKMAPERIQLSNGKRMRINYRPGSVPKGRARIQELYDVETNPTIAGDVKVLLEILGPNMRPVQITNDIGSFWNNLYKEIRPQLSRRYPKHEWR